MGLTLAHRNTYTNTHMCACCYGMTFNCSLGLNLIKAETYRCHSLLDVFQPYKTMRLPAFHPYFFLIFNIFSAFVCYFHCQFEFEECEELGKHYATSLATTALISSLRLMYYCKFWSCLHPCFCFLISGALMRAV